jgi:hypothetical protein
VLAFVLGAAAAALRSDLRLPDALYASLSIYLVLAIGLKGGASLSEAEPSEVWAPALASLVLGATIPLWSYAILRRAGRLGVADAAALAAHYGSISIVTFMATLAFLDALGVPYEGYMAALAALLEVPGIAVALLLANLGPGATRSAREAVRETLTGRSIMLLAGGLVIGLVCGPEGLASVKPFFVDPFQGALALFLLEMGRVAASRLSDLRESGAFVFAFAVVAPVVHGVLGVGLGYVAGLSLGGSVALGILSGSASYIAAPAAVRLALPEARPSLYLTPVLAVTFPFNLVVNIPLLHAVAERVYALGGAS